MPPTTQRRNTAYLNDPSSRHRGAGLRGLSPGTATWTGLAIDFGSSVERRFRRGELNVAYLGSRRASRAAKAEGNNQPVL